MESLPSAFVFTQLSLLEKNTKALQDYNKDQIFEVTILATNEGGDYGQGPLPWSRTNIHHFFFHIVAYGIKETNIFSIKWNLRSPDVLLDLNFISAPFCTELSLALKKACSPG
jgi:hypothetical protein